MHVAVYKMLGIHGLLRIRPHPSLLDDLLDFDIFLELVPMFLSFFKK